MVGHIIIIIALLVLFRILEKRFPRLCERIELPANIIFSLLVAVYCCFLIYDVYDTLTSNVSNGDKVFFIIFIGVIISVYVAMVIYTWIQWLNKRKKNK